MSKITSEEVEKLAKLARVGLTRDEVASLTVDMNAILDYAKQLETVDISGVDPTSQVTGLANITREDAIRRSELKRAELLSNTPAEEGGYIKVRSVL